MTYWRSHWTDGLQKTVTTEKFTLWEQSFLNAILGPIVHNLNPFAEGSWNPPRPALQIHGTGIVYVNLKGPSEAKYVRHLLMRGRENKVIGFIQKKLK